MIEVITRWWLSSVQPLVYKVYNQLGGGKGLIFLLGFVSLILALSGFTVTANKYRYRYLFVVDITQSMNVQDMFRDTHRVSRLDYVKHKIKAILPTIPCSSEVSLGIFTGHRSFILFKPVELCQHFSEINSAIDTIDWRMAWEAKSEVSKGLHSAIKVSRQLGEDVRVIFFSDGHEAPPLHEKYAPRFKGEKGQIKGAIVGIGADLPVPIPKYSYENNFVGFWSANEVLQVDTYSLGRSASDESLVGVDAGNIDERVAQGTEHLSSIKQVHLKELSRNLGLEYFRLGSNSDFKSLLRSAKYAIRYTGEVDIAKYLAMFALFCFTAYFLWPFKLSR